MPVTATVTATVTAPVTVDHGYDHGHGLCQMLGLAGTTFAATKWSRSARRGSHGGRHGDDGSHGTAAKGRAHTTVVTAIGTARHGPEQGVTRAVTGTRQGRDRDVTGT